MSFQTLGFLAFLAVTVPLCRLAGRRSVRLGTLCLTAASLVFYVLGGGWAGLAALAAGLAVTAGALRYLEAGGGRRRFCLTLAAAWHIGALAVFKYAGFLTGGALSAGWAPLGLSFFTFQQLWLLKESYTGGFRLERREALPLYAFFFPSVVSGPILKPQAFFPQLEGGAFLRPSGRDCAAGLWAIAMGTGKKVLLADNLGVLTDSGWSRLEDLSAPGAWLVILGYTLQLYLDFSGYCDIASGVARLLGLRLPVNFNSPYRSLSVGEFWKRWHITLTTFLRECLYFPLGGSKRGNARTYGNILAVFLLSGLWHGAGWTFLVWGGLHGLGQILERALGEKRERLPAVLRWGLTFFFVNLAWVFFRAPSLAGAGRLLSAAFAGPWTQPESWLYKDVLSKEFSALFLLFPGLQPWDLLLRTLPLYGLALAVVLWPRNTAEQMERLRPTLGRGVLAAAVAAVSILSFTGITTFIYSNF